MRNIILCSYFCPYIKCDGVFAQNQNSETKLYNGVYVEYNTLILLTHNLKLFTDLNYYKDENVVDKFTTWS